MKIDQITIKESNVFSPNFNGKKWALHIESAGYKYTGYFDNLMGFMQACSEAMKFFGQAHGAITVDKDGTVRGTKYRA